LIYLLGEKALLEIVLEHHLLNGDEPFPELEAGEIQLGVAVSDRVQENLEVLAAQIEGFDHEERLSLEDYRENADTQDQDGLFDALILHQVETHLEKVAKEAAEGGPLMALQSYLDDYFKRELKYL